MSKKKSTGKMLPKLEVLVILVFFFSFIIWAASKCNSSDIKDQFAEMTDRPPEENTIVVDTIGTDPYGKPLPPANPDPTAQNPATSTPSSTSTGAVSSNSANNPSEKLSILYVTIDGLNMRTGPHLDSAVVLQLPLFEEVYFLNEVTDSTQQISLGTEIADEPWVKIKHKRGKTGWVYGAGVNYYRKARLPQGG